MSKLTNLLGTLAAVLTVLASFFTAMGCAPGASDFAATCSIPFLPAEWLAYVSLVAGGVFGAAALLGKLTRPGSKLASLFGSTAVVSSKPGVGTVTPQQVNTP